MNKILIVEDEKSISQYIKTNLVDAGYLCRQVHDGQEAYRIIMHETYDLILLDVMIPYIDGFELIEYIRPLGIPVIFITAKDNLNDKVNGLKLGAEDYIVKPFEIIELLVRVEVVLRRYNKISQYLYLDNICVNTLSRKVTKDHKEIPLTKKNIDIIAVSSVLENEIKDNTVTMYLDYDMNSYKLDLNVNEYIVKDYPPRRGIEKEAIYVPYDMINDLLENEGIITSSSVSVICEDIMKVEETIKSIERWMNDATVSSESMQYLNSINMLKNIQKYIAVLRIVLICGITAVAYIVNLMENKARRREVTTLRINGFDKSMFYRLSFYENVSEVIIVLFAVVVGYVFISDRNVILLDMIKILSECIIYISVIKILPVLVSGQEIFKRDISSMLRDY